MRTSSSAIKTSASSVESIFPIKKKKKKEEEEEEEKEQ